jgi:hypothetical protein
LGIACLPELPTPKFAEELLGIKGVPHIHKSKR